jgi:hypothetical protein
VANNCFRQYLRNKYPHRQRLKNKIRYIVGNRPGLTIWQTAQGPLLCGLAKWKGNVPAGDRSIAEEDIQALRIERRWTAGSSDDNRGILELLEALFKRVERPLSLDAVVTAVAIILDISEALQCDLEENTWVDDETFEKGFINRLELQRFWESIGSLPVRHRSALLLNLRSDAGENLLAFLPALRIASIRQIASALEITPEQLADVWNRLPLDDKSVAERLGITRQQVINLRQSARTQLRRKRDADK